MGVRGSDLNIVVRPLSPILLCIVLAMEVDNHRFSLERSIIEDGPLKRIDKWTEFLSSLFVTIVCFFNKVNFKKKKPIKGWIDVSSFFFWKRRNTNSWFLLYLLEWLFQKYSWDEWNSEGLMVSSEATWGHLVSVYWWWTFWNKKNYPFYCSGGDSYCLSSRMKMVMAIRRG